MHSILVSVDDRGQRPISASEPRNTVEVEGDPRPALTADVLIVLYERRKKRLA